MNNTEAWVFATFASLFALNALLWGVVGIVTALGVLL